MNANKRFERRIAWLLAALTTAAMFACVLLFLDMRYCANDDSLMIRMFNGFEMGEPADFCTYMHGLMVIPLGWLGRLAPHVPWLSYLQMAFLFLSLTICQKSIMQCFVKAGRPLWGGFVLGGCYLACFGVYCVARPTYTQTAGMLSAAAVLQLMSVDADEQSPRSAAASMLGAAALLAPAYALRQMTALVALGFCAVGFVWLASCQYLRKRSLRPMLIALAAVAVLMAGMTLWRQAEISAHGMQAHLHWQQARTDLLDYYNAYALPQQAVDASGWSPATMQLVQNWCFLSPDITTQAFEAVTQVLEELNASPLPQQLNTAVKRVMSMKNAMPTEFRFMLAGPVAALCVLASSIIGRKWKQAAAMLGGCAVLAAMLLYLGLKGRLPAHAVMVPAACFAALAMGLVAGAIPRGRAGKALLCAVCAVCLLHGGVCMRRNLPPMLKSRNTPVGMSVTDLESYAAQHKDCLFIFDGTIVMDDCRVFPAYDAQNLPTNIVFWGGWGMHTPQNKQQFERFGIDLAQFAPQHLLQRHVYIATTSRDDYPARILSDWVSEQTGEQARMVKRDEWGCVKLYQVVME